MAGWLFALALLTAAGAAVIAGVFFAFSSFVMSALGRLPPPHGMAAMQSINRIVLRSAFMPVFLGTAVLSAATALLSGGDWRLIVGGLLYLVGCFGVTAFGNVPLNNRLERAAPESGDGAVLWADYLRRWTWWNHLRMAASFVAAILLVAACLP